MRKRRNELSEIEKTNGIAAKRFRFAVVILDSTHDRGGASRLYS
jgi:hypothetical protein